MQGWTATTRHGIIRKRSTKRLKHTWNLLRKNLQLNSRLKANKIIGRGKVFSRQRIPQYSCARKETVDIDILVTSKNGDREIIKTICRDHSRIKKWNQLRQFRQTTTKVTPIEKTLAGYISRMSQEFKRDSKWRTNSAAHPFLQII